MQGIYTYIPETNYVRRAYSVAAILLLLFMVLISLVSVLNRLYFYISSFRSMSVYCHYYYYCRRRRHRSGCTVLRHVLCFCKHEKVVLELS
jgi:hypothetical protein